MNSTRSLPTRRLSKARPCSPRAIRPVMVLVPARRLSAALMPTRRSCEELSIARSKAPLIGSTLPLAASFSAPARLRPARLEKGEMLSASMAISPLNASSAISPVRETVRSLPNRRAFSSRIGWLAFQAPSTSRVMRSPSASRISGLSADIPASAPSIAKVRARAAGWSRLRAMPPRSKVVRSALNSAVVRSLMTTAPDHSSLAASPNVRLSSARPTVVRPPGTGRITGSVLPLSTVASSLRRRRKPSGAVSALAANARAALRRSSASSVTPPSSRETPRAVNLVSAPKKLRNCAGTNCAIGPDSTASQPKP